LSRLDNKKDYLKLQLLVQYNPWAASPYHTYGEIRNDLAFSCELWDMFSYESQNNGLITRVLYTCVYYQQDPSKCNAILDVIASLCIVTGIQDEPDLLLK